MIGSDALPLSIMETDRRPSMSSIRRSNNRNPNAIDLSDNSLDKQRFGVGTNEWLLPEVQEPAGAVAE